MNAAPQQQTPTVAIDAKGDQSVAHNDMHTLLKQQQQQRRPSESAIFEPIAAARTPTELDFQAAIDAALLVAPEALGHPAQHRQHHTGGKHGQQRIGMVHQHDHISPSRRNSAGAQRVRSTSPKDMMSPYRRRVASLAEPGRQQQPQAHHAYRRRALSTPATPRGPLDVFDTYRDTGSPTYSESSFGSPSNGSGWGPVTLQQSDSAEDDLSALFQVGLAPSTQTTKDLVPMRCRSLPSSFWQPTRQQQQQQQHHHQQQQQQQQHLAGQQMLQQQPGMGAPPLDQVLGGYDFMAQHRTEMMLPGGVRRDSRPYMSSPLRSRAHSASVTMTTDLDTLSFLDSVARSPSPGMLKLEAHPEMHHIHTHSHPHQQQHSGGNHSPPSHMDYGGQLLLPQPPHQQQQHHQDLSHLFSSNQLGDELDMLGISRNSPEHNLFGDFSMGFTTTV